MSRPELDVVKIEGMGLVIDESTNIRCPFCTGSSRNPASLSITRKDTGLVYNCYRASCPAKGFISSNPSEIIKHAKPKKTKKARPYTKETTQLPPRVTQWLDANFGLSEDTIYSEGWKWNVEQQRIVMPIRDNYHHTTGHNSRYWSELDEVGVVGGGPKSITYWDNPDCTKLHFPMTCGQAGTLALVEDQPSAVRLSQDYNCVALLGTHITAEMAELLAMMRYDRVTLVLDADATAKAIKLKQQWGFYFSRMNILPLRGPDIKDMSSLEYTEFLKD